MVVLRYQKGKNSGNRCRTFAETYRTWTNIRDYRIANCRPLCNTEPLDYYGLGISTFLGYLIQLRRFCEYAALAVRTRKLSNVWTLWRVKSSAKLQLCGVSLSWCVRRLHRNNPVNTFVWSDERFYDRSAVSGSQFSRLDFTDQTRSWPKSICEHYSRSFTRRSKVVIYTGYSALLFL